METHAKVARLVSESGGIMTTAALLRACTRRELAGAVAAGAVTRLGRGSYGVPAGTGPESARARDAAVRTNGVISHQSAAEWHRWELRTLPERPVITVPRGRKVPERLREEIDVRWGDLSPWQVDGIVTTPLATVVACARTMDYDEALAVADSALRSGVVGRDELRAAARNAPRTGRPAAIKVAEAADGRSANAFESVVRAISHRVTGLALEPQQRVLPSIICDLVDHRCRIVVECDSWTYHAEKSAFHRDLQRYNSLAVAGWLILRFDRTHALERPEYVEREMAAAVRARGDRGAS